MAEDDSGRPPIRFMQPGPEGELRANVCPNCGAPVHFGDGTHTTCEHCGVEVEKIAPAGQTQDDRKKSEDEKDTTTPTRSSYYPMGGFNPTMMMLMMLMYAAMLNTHSTYTSTYTGAGAAHPAHVHGVGGFAG